MTKKNGIIDVNPSSQPQGCSLGAVRLARNAAVVFAGIITHMIDVPKDAAVRMHLLAKPGQGLQASNYILVSLHA